MVVYPEQQQMLGEYFGGLRETVIIVPKKNGKTTMLAALALYHLCTTPEAACFIAASSRDQATILYDQARGFVRRSDFLDGLVDVKAGYRELRSKLDDGRVRVLAADADTADGVLPTLALVDELHRHKSTALYGVFRDGLGPRRGQMITISTAGANEDTPLGKLRNAAYAMPTFAQHGTYRTARNPDFAMHEWALEMTDDLTDLALVAKANPAPWQTEEELRRRRDSPTMDDAQWARFACGVWGIGSAPAFDRQVFAALVNSGPLPAPGRVVTLGFDGARRRDGTGLVGCDVATGRLFTLGYWQAPPNAPEDWEVPEHEVTERVGYAFERWKVWALYGDPPYWESALDSWAGTHGVTKVVRWWTNRIKATAIALRAFRNDMVAERMSHDGDERLVEHIGNAVRQDTRMEENGELLWVIRKEGRDSPRKIDLAMAAMLAWTARGDATAKGALQTPDYGSAQW